VSTPTLAALSAVVVDDHRLLAQSIAISLRQEGVACTVAALTDPVSLVAGIVEERPDVVLLDLDLGTGIGDGGALVAPLVAAGCRVLLVTASTDPVRLAVALEAGAVGVLAKTEPIEVLLEAATRAARGERVMDDVRERSLLRDARTRRDSLACFGRLTGREAQVLRALGRGENVAAIAAASYVSEATVRSQVRGVLTKLGAGSQLEAVALAHRAGWLDRPRT
jgi:DNA-binding NarL/FixJ family response regulator